MKMHRFLGKTGAACGAAAVTLVLLASCGPRSEEATQPGSSAARSDALPTPLPVSASPAPGVSTPPVPGVPAPAVDNSAISELATYNLNVTPADPATENPKFTAAQAAAAAEATNTHYGKPFEMSLVRFTNTAFGAKVQPGSTAQPTPAMSNRLAWLVLFNNVQITAAGPAPTAGTPAGPPATEKVLMAEFLDSDTGAFVYGTTLNPR
jgi:hypothetical protein